MTFRESVVEIKNLDFGYDSSKVLESIELHVLRGEFLAFIGPNGGGKSTLLKLLLGILTPQKGSLKIFGKHPREVIEKIGYVPQDTNINIHFPIKVIDVVLTGLSPSKKKIFGYSKEEREKAEESLKRVGMLALKDKKIGALSGGQRQRAMIARTLCADPSLLLLDEPTSNIDAKGQREIYELLKTLKGDMTVIVVSHDISVVLDFADSIAHINRYLSYHDSPKTTTAELLKGLGREGGHLCEVEILQLLGAKGQR